MKTLKFWGRLVGLELFSVLCSAAMMMIIMVVNISTYDNTKIENSDYLLFAAVNLLLGGGFALFILRMSYFTTYFPLAVSMNMTRRHFCVGQFVTATVMSILISGGATALFAANRIISSAYLLPLFADILGVMLLISAYGMLGSGIWLRFRTVGVVFYIIGTIAAFIGCSILICFNVDRLITFTDITTDNIFSVLSARTAVIFGICILLYLLVCGIITFLLRRQEIKA